MSDNLDGARYKISGFSVSAYSEIAALSEQAKATALLALAEITKAEEQRITNLIALVPLVIDQNRQDIVDELASRLGFSELVARA